MHIMTFETFRKIFYFPNDIKFLFCFSSKYFLRFIILIAMVTNGLNDGTAVKHHLNEIVRYIRNFVVTLRSRLNRHGHNNSTNI